MYKISTVGEREALYVSNEIGTDIKEIWENDAIPNDTKIKTKEWSGYKASIKSIHKEKETDSREQEGKRNQEYFNQKDQEWRDYRRTEQLKTPQERSRELSWFHLVRQACIGDTEVPEEVLKKVTEIQCDFFTQNPYNLLCQPKLFFPFFPGMKGMSIGLGDTIVTAVMKDNEYSLQEEKYATSFLTGI